jgi:hypothetical protein
LERTVLLLGEAFALGAGALGFRDFPGSLVMKENRTGNHQTLPHHAR